MASAMVKVGTRYEKAIDLVGARRIDEVAPEEWLRLPISKRECPTCGGKMEWQGDGRWECSACSRWLWATETAKRTNGRKMEELSETDT